MQITPQATAAFQLAPPAEKSSTAWLSAWPDALAFAVGLGAAWWAGWSSADLVWSLWLSSLVVGYATIVWIVGQRAGAMAAIAWGTRTDPLSSPWVVAAFFGVILFFAAFTLGFFTVHFGGFHYVHSQLLLNFFPLDAPGAASANWADRATYLEVLRRYWIFLPSAFLSHRAAFLRKPLPVDRERWLESLTGSGKKNRDQFLDPYRNVMRMHGLIFFFFLAHFAKLDNFVLYAVVYVVYFFPWRLVRGEGSVAQRSHSE